MRVPVPGSLDSGAAALVIARPSATIGRLIQKIARQSSAISAPPTSGPNASAIAEIPAQMPTARACLSDGKTLHTIASERVSMGAAPAP